jgi:outer membrane receptor protein involved in Fe transport
MVKKLWMPKKAVPFQKKLLVCAVISGLVSSASYGQQDDESDIEEVVVTGSFIRGSPIDAPSPVQVVDRESIEAQGAAVIWDVIKNLEINSGSFTDNGSGEVYGTAGTAQVNLRNLGENSTLTLINGKRMVPSGATTRAGGEYVDINSIPLVMTDRIEILTDGGSALYGADAVAGVVNIIMRTDFEGLELFGDLQSMVGAGDAFDATVSGIWGWASDSGNTHFVLSGERFERDPVSVRDANFWDDGTSFIAGRVNNVGSLFGSSYFGGQINPAWKNDELKAIRQAAGGSSSTQYTDPLCASGLTDASGNPFFVRGMDPRQRARPGRNSDDCSVDTSEWALIAYEQERDSVAGSFDHTFANGTEFYSFASWSDQTTIRGGSGYRQSFGTTFFPSPGAYSRARGEVFELGHFAPLFGNEIPTNITNNPADLANGGPNTVYRAGMAMGVTRPGGAEDSTLSDTGNIQFGLRGDFEIADRTLEYDVSYSAGYSSVETQRVDFDRYRSHLAGVGLAGPNCTPNGVSDFDFRHAANDGGNGWSSYGGYFRYVFEGYFVQEHEPISLGLTSSNQGKDGCQFFNPMLTAQTNPALANSPELIDWLTQHNIMKDKRNSLEVFDATVTGELVQMRGGMGAFALGGQYRGRTAKARASRLNHPITLNVNGFDTYNAITGYGADGVPNQFGYVSNNMGGASNSYTFDLDRSITAVYGELSLPFLENIESQIALRYEDYGGTIGSEISPKVAASWRPTESFLVRGSWSQSFRAPNLGIIGMGLDASSVTFLDPLDNQAVRAGILPPTAENGTLESTYTLGGPAPNVGNEYADTFSAGFIWTPSGDLEGLSVQADFWRFEVTDRVLPENANSALQRQVDAFSAAAASSNNYVLNESLDSSSGDVDLYQSCDPTALTSQYGLDSSERLNCVVDPRLYQVPGVEEWFPSMERSLIQLKLGAINAGEITADGIDAKLGYRWDNEFGQFNASLDYTFVNQYKLSNIPGLDNGLLDIGVSDAAGTTGDGNLVRSLPDRKGHITLSWNQGRHGVTLIGRYIGSYTDLTYDLRYSEQNPLVQSLMNSEIASYDRWDLQYRYVQDWDNARLGSTIFTLGVLDVFDADIPIRETGSLDYDAQVFDGRGQRIYARALWQF